MSRDETPRILPAPPLAYTLYSAAPLTQGHDEHRVVVRDDVGELLGAFDLSA